MKVSAAVCLEFIIRSLAPFSNSPSGTSTATQAMAGAKAQKTVLVTGATRGIGLELAAQYKKSGWTVIGAVRNLNKAAKLEALAPYKIVQIDMSDEASILQAAKVLEGEAIDLLVNNAGIFEGDTFSTANKESLLRQFEVNAVGPFLMTRAFTPQLRAAAAKNGSAVVAQISSSMGSIEQNGGGYYGYRTSKTALNMINSSLALDLKEDKIFAVSLCPGYVKTDMNHGHGYIDVHTSVAGLSKVIAGLKQRDSGRFFSHDGSSLSW